MSTIDAADYLKRQGINVDDADPKIDTIQFSDNSRLKVEEDNPDLIVVEKYNSDTESYDPTTIEARGLVIGDVEVTKVGDSVGYTHSGIKHIMPSVDLDQNNQIGKSLTVSMPEVYEEDAAIQPSDSDEWSGNHLLFKILGGSNNITSALIGCSGSVAPDSAVNVFVYPGYLDLATIVGSASGPDTALAGRKALSPIIARSIGKDKFGANLPFTIDLEDHVQIHKDAPYTIFMRTRDQSDFSLEGAENLVPDPELGGTQPFVPKILTNRSISKETKVPTEADQTWDFLAEEGLLKDSETTFASLQDAIDACTAAGGGKIGIEGTHTGNFVLSGTADIAFINVKDAVLQGAATQSAATGNVIEMTSTVSTANFEFDFTVKNSAEYGILIKSGNSVKSRCKYINCGQDGNVVDPLGPRVDGVIEGTDSTDVQLSDAYAASGAAGGCIRVENVKYVDIDDVAGIEGDTTSASFRGIRIQDCGRNNGRITARVLAYYTAESSLYFASGSNGGCENATYEVRSYAACHSPLLIIGGKKISGTVFGKDCWGEPCHWHASEVIGDYQLTNCGVQAYTFIGAGKEAGILGGYQDPTSKYLGIFKYTGTSPGGTTNYCINIAPDVGAITNNPEICKIIIHNSFISGYDAAIKQTGINDKASITRIGNTFTNNVKNIDVPAQAFHHVNPYADVYHTLNELDIQKDGNRLRLYEGIGGHHLDTYSVCMLSAVAKGSDKIDIQQKGSRSMIYEDIPVTAFSLNGTLLTGDQTSVMSQLNAILSDVSSPTNAVAGLTWDYDISTTAADPTSGKLRTDTGKVYISAEATNTADQTSLFNSLVTGDKIFLLSNDDDTQYLALTLSGSPTDNTGWFTFDSTEDDAGLAFTDGASLTVEIHTVGSAVIPFASGSPNVYYHSDNQQYTDLHTDDEYLYYGQQLDKDAENLLLITNYASMGSTGHWEIGELEDTFVDAGDFSGNPFNATGWHKRIRFNGNYILADTSVGGSHTIGYDTVTGDEVYNTSATNIIGFEYDKDDSKMRLKSYIDLPIITDLLTEQVVGDGEPKTISLTGQVSTANPMPVYQFRRSFGQWDVRHGEMYGSPWVTYFGPWANPMKYTNPMKPGFICTVVNNQTGGGGSLSLGIWGGSNAVGTANLSYNAYYDIKVNFNASLLFPSSTDGWTWVGGINNITFVTGDTLKWHHRSSDKYIDLYTIIGGVETLVATSTLPHNLTEYLMTATTGAQYCEVPELNFEIEGDWEKVHRYTLLSTLQMVNGLNDEDVIRPKTALSQGKYYEFNLDSTMAQKFFIGDWDSANPASGQSSIHNTAYWNDVVDYNSTGKLNSLGNAENITLNASNSLYDAVNGWWQNSGTTTVRFRYHVGGARDLYDVTRSEVIATFDLSVSGDQYMYLGCSDANGLPAVDIPQITIGDI